MPEYRYTALAADGSMTEGSLVAPDESALDEHLRGIGAFLVRAEVHAAAAAKGRQRTDGNVPRKELLAFLEYVAGSFEVGIPILATLSDVEQRVQGQRFRRIVSEVRLAVSEDGKSLSDALAEHPEAFPELYVGTIRAGEASGHLGFAMRQLVDYLDWQESISSQLQQATMYPAIVLTAVGFLVVGLIGFVFPRILPLLRTQKAALPLPTRILLALSLFLRGHWSELIAVTALTAAAVWSFRRTPRGRLVTDGLVLRLPIIGPVIRDVNVARLVTYLSLFYRTGVEIVLALSICERILTNRVVAAAVGAAREQITGGTPMATAFAQSPIFPAVLRRSIALGEATGNLDEALGRARQYYSREIPATVRRVITVLQPMLIVLIGGVILTVALAIVLPILNIYNSIGMHR